ncbi:hypothetical protein [Kitasatospora paranensis]|uniref:Integral membrane protein n=1 Tax=Kitasatospora paranensis TaxID=258053 RepID=A0ABW2FRE1_9ACTN
MSTASAPQRRQVPRTPALRHLRCAAGLEHNPLCRHVDRARSRLVLAAVVALALSVAASTVVALVLLHGMRAGAAETARHRHQVTATTTAAPTGGAVQGVAAGAQAVWSYPAGHRDTGVIEVPNGAPVGADVRIWVDDSGAQAPAPSSAGELEVSASVYGLAAFCGMTAAAGGAYLLRRSGIERAAARGWEAEWTDVEPVWSRRSRPGGPADQ